MKNIKQILTLGTLALFIVTLNGAYLEYCVGRLCPGYIAIPLLIVLVAVDFVALRYAVKTILKLLNF